PSLVTFQILGQPFLTVNATLKPQFRVIPRLPQIKEHLAGKRLGDLLPLCCLPEERQGGERLPMDRVCLEDRRHMASKGLDLLGATLASVKDSDLQRDERHVVGHVAGSKLAAHPGEEGNPFVNIAETCTDAPFRPHMSNAVQLATGLEEVCA